MRDKKFRAWSTDDKGFYVPVINQRGKSCDLWYGYEVVGENDDPIMQYTGLKDKNGTEIYDGDIVEADQDTYEVIWNTDCCLGYGWGLWSITNKGFRKLDGFSTYSVIGNIYENPELLEGV